MNVIKMIKSGLVNQKRGGGFEQGYPSQKYPKGRDEFIRPYVNNSDPTILRKSEYSDPMAYKAVTPSPVQYNDIFRKKPTPDERLYILKQIQQGLDKVQKGILGKIPGIPPPSVPPAGAPSGTQPTDEVGQTIGAPPTGPPPSSDGAGGILIDETPDAMVETPTSSVGVPIAEYNTTIPQEFRDARQTDGVDEVNAALNADELAAVPLTMDQVTEDVVTGNRSMIAEDSGPSNDTPAEDTEKVDISKKPRAPSWWEGSVNSWKAYWGRQSPAKKREIVKEEMAMQGPQPEIKLPTARRPANPPSKLKI